MPDDSNAQHREAIARLTDQALVIEWEKCPLSDELSPWFQAVIDEMERRHIDF